MGEITIIKKKNVNGFILEINSESSKIISIATNLGYLGGKISVGDTVVSNGRFFVPKGTYGEVININEPYTFGKSTNILSCNFNGKRYEMKHKDLVFQNNSYVVNKKYRLGNKPEEYELVTKYLGWFPEDNNSWEHLFFPFIPLSSEIKNKEIVIVSPNKTDKATIILHHQIIKDAFPLSFFGEERSKNWHHFCIVSTKENSNEKFIIPLH